MGRRTDRLEVDVAIVGAGLAGLVCARRLVEAGATASSSRLAIASGAGFSTRRSATARWSRSAASGSGPTQDRIAALGAELGVGTFPTHDEGRHVVDIGGRRTTFEGSFTDARLGLVRELATAISPLALADFEQARARLDRMASRVPVEAPWTAPRAREWDAPDLRRPGSAATPARGPRAACSSWPPRPSGRPSRRTSPCSTSSSTRAPGGGFNRLIGTGGGAQQDRFRGGSQLLALRLAEELGAETHAASARRCASIAHGRRRASSLSADGADSGAALGAAPRRAIVAIPPTLAGRIAYDPPLPALRDQLTAADAAGDGDQDDGRLRDVPSGARRASRGRRRATSARHGSSSTTRRPTALPASCSASSRAAWPANGGSRPPS